MDVQLSLNTALLIEKDDIRLIVLL